MAHSLPCENQAQEQRAEAATPGLLQSKGPCSASRAKRVTRV